MSNGIGKNPLNDISRVYLQQVSEKKKDDTYLEPDMKKRQANNEKARKDMEKMGTSMKNPHFEEKQQGWDVVNTLADAYKEMHQVDEADSLAAMQARREKRLAAQRKREGTTVTGRDFGHDYSLTPAQQKARRDAEFKAGIGTKKEEVENVEEGKSDRPLGVMHSLARGMKQKRGAKRNEGDGKYLKMQHTKKQNKKEADLDAHRERQRNERGLPEEVDPKSDAMLAKKKQMLQKQYMLDKMRMQMQKQGKLPMGSQRSGSAMESTESNIDEKINPLLKGILKKTPKGEDPEKGGVPYKRTGKMTEGLSVDDQMKISRDAAKGRNPNPDHKAIRGKMLRKPLPKDTRTDAEKMTAAVGKPRMGSSD